MDSSLTKQQSWQNFTETEKQKTEESNSHNQA